MTPAMPVLPGDRRVLVRRFLHIWQTFADFTLGRGKPARFAAVAMHPRRSPRHFRRCRRCRAKSDHRATGA
jgi:hypothetical protein